MKVTIRNKADGSIYKELNAVRVATRNNPTCKEEIELIVYSGGHGYAFNTRFYEVEIKEK